ncbi:MAG: hypothetical protein Q7R96_02265 [Nanoarchaeota archaeon]|nr:hypothetical protein [Nanoarchaeota archaeon]
MINLRLEGSFEETAALQEKYRRILVLCRMQGSLILQDCLLEWDADIAPHKFFRKGVREYIFPKQGVDVKEKSSRVVDATPRYKLWTREWEFSFDEEKVSGYLHVEYQDADNHPCLQIFSKDKAVFPEDFLKNLEDILGVTQTIC